MDKRTQRTDLPQNPDDGPGKDRIDFLLDPVGHPEHLRFAFGPGEEYQMEPHPQPREFIRVRAHHDSTGLHDLDELSGHHDNVLVDGNIHGLPQFVLQDPDAALSRQTLCGHSDARVEAVRTGSARGGVVHCEDCEFCAETGAGQWNPARRGKCLAAHRSINVRKSANRETNGECHLANTVRR